MRVWDLDGRLRRVAARGPTRKAAEHRLKEKLARRADYATGTGELTPDTSFGRLVDLWLEDLDLEGKLAPSMRVLYERNMRQLVMPAFENYALRKIRVAKVDRFIKALATTRSYSMAKQARTVLSLAWTVTHIGRHGTLDVRRAGDPTGARVTLPAGYVARHVDLGYAVTAHRAQGVTVDTAHVVVSSSTTRENLYVAMTRGRHANTAYVALDKPDPLHATPADADTSARTVLFGVLQHCRLEQSAHQTIAADQERWTGIAQLAAEYETIATTAQQGRWTRLVTDTLVGAGGLTKAEASRVIASEAFAVLIAELRRAEANRHDVHALLKRVVAQRTLLDAADVAAVLAARLARAAGRPTPGTTPDLVAGLLPAATGPLPADAARALAERRELIEGRARTLAEAAIRDRAPWAYRIGERPTGASDRKQWLAELTVVAAYRDRYAITSPAPLGASTQTLVQERDRRRAAEALRRAPGHHPSPQDRTERCAHPRAQPLGRMSSQSLGGGPAA